jgi:hypothetical protein
MSLCLITVYRFLKSIEFFKGIETIDTSSLIYFLSQKDEFIIDTLDEKHLIYLADDDFTNEFGLEIRKEYFQERFMSTSDYFD